MKASIRKSVLKKMKGLEPENKRKADQALIQRLRSLSAYQEASVIATYLSFPHEVDTSFLIDAAQEDGKQVVIPKTYPKGRMEFATYDPQKLKPTAFGLLEPEDGAQAVDQSKIDLIHVPGWPFKRMATVWAMEEAITIAIWQISTERLSAPSMPARK